MRLSALRKTFSSLSVRNFRLYMSGQLISMSGTWMQTVAQALLVLQLTGQGTDLGIVTALQFLPALLLGPLGGVIADRFDKRAILYCTQGASGVLALILGTLVATDAVQLWMVYILAAGLGAANALDSPARNTFVFELVGSDRLTNAVSLNSGMVNLARIIGPAIAALLIATVGLAACFFYNATSFVAVLVALALIKSSELQRMPIEPRKKGQIRAGFRYVRGTPELLAPLLMVTVIGIFAWEFPVTLPLLAEFTFHGSSGAYSAMAVCMGVGAIVGTLIIARRERSSGRELVVVALAFGVSILAAAAAPNLTIALVVMVPLGGFAFALLAIGNVTLQLSARPEMRGRVMALWFVAIIGTTPIGAPLMGWIGDDFGPRYGLAIGGIASILAGVCAYPALVRRPQRLALLDTADAPVDTAFTEEIELSQ